MMLGLLLARAGIDVIVLEKHRDFLRDFRGDTIHPSTLQIMHELGLLETFLALPHDEVREIEGNVRGVRVPIADFTHLPTRCQFLAFMPQWDFLDFLAAEARRYPSFTLAHAGGGDGPCRRPGAVEGVVATTPEGRFEVRADLVVGADGRHSTVRERAGLAVEEFGAPIDVLWFTLPRRAGQVAATAGYVGAGHILVMLDARDLLAMRLRHRQGVVRTASGQQGLSALARQRIAVLAPDARGPRGGTADWDASSCSRCRSTACGNGAGRVCCASATPRTRCRPSAASASTSRFRMRWRRATC